MLYGWNLNNAGRGKDRCGRVGADTTVPAVSSQITPEETVRNHHHATSGIIVMFWISAVRGLRAARRGKRNLHRPRKGELFPAMRWLGSSRLSPTLLDWYNLRHCVCIQGDFFIALRPLHFENVRIGIICWPQIDFEHLNFILFSDFERVRRGGFFGLSI